MQLAKQRRIAVDVRDPIFAHIAGSQRQETRRANIARVRNEHDAVAVADSIAAGGTALPDLLARHAIRAHLFERHARKEGASVVATIKDASAEMA